MLDLKRTSKDTLATIEFQLDWKSENARHVDRFTAQRVNLWRDFFPLDFREKLMNRAAGDIVDMVFSPGKIFPDRKTPETRTIKKRQLHSQLSSDINLVPRLGRFYPKGLLKDMPGIFRANIEPFRLVGLNNGNLNLDLNHPLSAYEMGVQAIIKDVREKFDERGGTSNDWLGAAADGPGMQARWKNLETDFFSDNPFERTDEKDDSIFYEKPRFVQHLDDTAIRNVSAIYGLHLKPGMKVLDLMSSWQSHLPKDVELKEVIGLGLNSEELAANPQLSEYWTLDLNKNESLPFSDAEFDAIVCTASVEYLIRPFSIFREAARVLKSGGVMAMAFSNRWFPPKAIRIWSEIHEFERVGLVVEYFLKSSLFRNVVTYSVRGMPRPDYDKYARQFAYSDPVHAVVAKRI